MDENDALSGQDAAIEEDKEEKSTNELVSMESLLEEEGLTLDFPKQGEIRNGVIASINNDEILVSIGAKSEGVIPAKELDHLSEEEHARLQIGAEIPVFVVSPESRQGNLLLSYTRALEEDDWANAEELMASREIHEGIIDGYNKGGLIVHLGRLRGFVPASQISMNRRTSYRGDTPEQRWGKMVGEPIITRVIEVDRQRRRLILSERAASQESREALKERLLDELEEGETRQGRVTSLADFGAFVNINGADGLVHLSEISWDRISHPKEILHVGQEVQVKVISIDRERKRIGLSLRQLQDDPWIEKINQYKVGQLVEGEITRLAKFGAFARIDDELEGLIHISELSEKRIEHPKEAVTEGDQLTLRIIKLDTERRRIGLSLRKVDSLAFSDLDWELALAEIEEDETEPSSEELPAPLEETDAETPMAAEEGEQSDGEDMPEPMEEPQASLASEEPDSESEDDEAASQPEQDEELSAEQEAEAETSQSNDS